MFQKINYYFSSRKNLKLINEISDKYLKQVNSLEEEITKLSQGELIDKINLLKDNYFKNEHSALKEEDIFLICAITRDVSKRTLGLRHFDSQIIGGIALYHGNLTSEIRSEELV